MSLLTRSLPGPVGSVPVWLVHEVRAAGPQGRGNTGRGRGGMDEDEAV